MKFPMVWRKAAEDEAAVWKAEATRQRRRAEAAERSLATERAARRRATESCSDLFDEHERVTGRNALLCAQVEDAKTSAFDQEKAQQMADRIGRLQKGVARARAEATAEGRRADRLQSRLDDALGLNTSAVAAGETWQARREDRMRFDKPTAEEATAR